MIGEEIRVFRDTKQFYERPGYRCLRGVDRFRAALCLEAVSHTREAGGEGRNDTAGVLFSPLCSR